MSTATDTEAPSTTGPRLKQKYHDEVKGALKIDLSLSNVMQVPRARASGRRAAGLI